MIERVAPGHDRIWYLADGVYSMFADLAPFAELRGAAGPLRAAHLYIDDSHGVGWAGSTAAGRRSRRSATTSG